MLGCLCLLLEPSRAAWKKSAVEKTGAYFESEKLSCTVV